MDFEKVKNMIAEQLKVDPAEIKPESRLMEERGDTGAVVFYGVSRVEKGVDVENSLYESEREEQKI